MEYATALPRAPVSLREPVVATRACSSLARGVRREQRRQRGRSALPRRLCGRRGGYRLPQAGCGRGTPGGLGCFGRLRMRPLLVPGASGLGARARRDKQACGLRADITVLIAAARLRDAVHIIC